MKEVVAALLILGLCASGWANQEPSQEMAAEAPDAAHYVTKMALIQGHLWVAAQLVEAGEMDLGAKHAKHPPSTPHVSTKYPNATPVPRKPH